MELMQASSLNLYENHTYVHLTFWTTDQTSSRKPLPIILNQWDLCSITYCSLMKLNIFLAVTNNKASQIHPNAYYQQFLDFRESFLSHFLL